MLMGQKWAGPGARVEGGVVWRGKADFICVCIRKSLKSFICLPLGLYSVLVLVLRQGARRALRTRSCSRCAENSSHEIAASFPTSMFLIAMFSPAAQQQEEEEALPLPLPPLRPAPPDEPPWQQVVQVGQVGLCWLQQLVQQWLWHREAAAPLPAAC